MDIDKMTDDELFVMIDFSLEIADELNDHYVYDLLDDVRREEGLSISSLTPETITVIDESCLRLLELLKSTDEEDIQTFILEEVIKDYGLLCKKFKDTVDFYYR